MAHKFRTLREPILADPVRRARVEEIKSAMHDAMEITRLREARDSARRNAAERLDVSRIEHEDDLYLSTLSSYIAELRGRLELRAVFSDEIVEIMPASEVRGSRH